MHGIGGAGFFVVVDVGDEFGDDFFGCVRCRAVESVWSSSFSSVGIFYSDDIHLPMGKGVRMQNVLKNANDVPTTAAAALATPWKPVRTAADVDDDCSVSGRKSAPLGIVLSSTERREARNKRRATHTRTHACKIVRDLGVANVARVAPLVRVAPVACTTTTHRQSPRW